MLNELALVLSLVVAKPAARPQVFWYRQSEARPMIEHWIRLEVSDSRVKATYIEVGLGSTASGKDVANSARGFFSGVRSGDTFRVTREKATLKGSFYRSLGLARTESATFGAPNMRVLFIVGGTVHKTTEFNQRQPSKEQLARMGPTTEGNGGQRRGK